MRHSMIVAVALAALCCSACSSTDETVVVSTSAPAGTATPVPTMADLLFINALKSQHIAYSSEPNMIAIGHKVCEARRAGVPRADVAETITSSGYSATNADYIITMAHKHFCPELH